MDTAGTGKALTLISIIQVLEKKKPMTTIACRGVVAQQFGFKATTVYNFVGYPSYYNRYQPFRNK